MSAPCPRRTHRRRRRRAGPRRSTQHDRRQARPLTTSSVTARRRHHRGSALAAARPSRRAGCVAGRCHERGPAHRPEPRTSPPRARGHGRQAVGAADAPACEGGVAASTSSPTGPSCDFSDRRGSDRLVLRHRAFGGLADPRHRGRADRPVHRPRPSTPDELQLPRRREVERRATMRLRHRVASRSRWGSGPTTAAGQPGTRSWPPGAEDSASPPASMTGRSWPAGPGSLRLLGRWPAGRCHPGRRGDRSRDPRGGQCPHRRPRPSPSTSGRHASRARRPFAPDGQSWCSRATTPRPARLSAWASSTSTAVTSFASWTS